MTVEILTVGGGVAGVFAFIVAMSKIFSQDRTWRSLITEIRSELLDCRTEREQERLLHERERGEWHTEKSALEERIQGLEGEVISLRREVHADRWLGIDPIQRPSPEPGG